MKTKIFRNLNSLPLGEGRGGAFKLPPLGGGLGWGLLLCLLLTASCIKNVDDPMQTIVLAAPEDNLFFDLDAIKSITFKWSMLDDVDKYRIAFSLNEDMIPATTLDATASPLAVPTADIDAALELLNMSAGKTAMVYWSVRPNPIFMNIETQVRTLKLTRKQ